MAGMTKGLSPRRFSEATMAATMAAMSWMPLEPTAIATVCPAVIRADGLQRSISRRTAPGGSGSQESSSLCRTL